MGQKILFTCPIVKRVDAMVFALIIKRGNYHNARIIFVVAFRFSTIPAHDDKDSSDHQLREKIDNVDTQILFDKKALQVQFH